MITYDLIRSSQEYLVNEWGEQGKRVIEECAQVTPYNGGVDSFVSIICTDCKGDQCATLQSGIYTLYPNVFHAIPNYMGRNAFTCLTAVLALCGIDPSE